MTILSTDENEWNAENELCCWFEKKKKKKTIYLKIQRLRAINEKKGNQCCASTKQEEFKMSGLRASALMLMHDVSQGL